MPHDPPPTVAVRPARAADRGQVHDLVRASYREFADVLAPEHYATLRTNLDRLVATVDERALIVAEAGRRVVGSVAYLAPGHPDYTHVPQDWAVIRCLAVTPRLRGRGVAAALTAQCLERAAADRAPHVGLHTAELMAAARGLYTGLGFVVHEEFPHLGVRFLVYRLDR